MVIKKLKVSNFKSFKDLEVELGKFNVLIGANASGKSNFVQIFRFLRDIKRYGLENAVSMQGGFEYLKNITSDISNSVSLKLVSNEKFILGKPHIKGKKNVIDIKDIIDIYETVYEFALQNKDDDPGFEIFKDILSQKCKFYKFKEKKKQIIGKGEIILSNINGEIKVSLHKQPKDIPIYENEIYPPYLLEDLSSHTLICQTIFFLTDIFGGISIYDFDTKLSKEGTPITGKAELEEDGSNLSIVLKNILEDKEKRRKFVNLIQDLLPFINDLAVEKFADKSLLFKLQETYFKNQYLPASLISDGTINITALIIALYFEKHPITIIEEPERNIHPYLISRIVDMMKDVAEKKQIIITTHNPEIVKYAGLENILLVSRDENGFSTISRPKDKEEVKIFLENEIGVEELYIQNLWGA